ncbi:hypothetical protein UUU_26390 (plasmid) [Klebsiella pneumoniae subsp. pneumoniae DSM 30104 = JCM 1662 = NBRC 14940]|nr:hypothetical protein UUU_26390 [Klebsiella pneumoniae subsp. pneumoniae DSM 30104 = JCM 1662 = NBRC 14940]
MIHKLITTPTPRNNAILTEQTRIVPPTYSASQNTRNAGIISRMDTIVDAREASHPR